MNITQLQNRRIKLCQSLKKQYNFDVISLMPTNFMEQMIITMIKIVM